MQNLILIFDVHILHFYKKALDNSHFFADFLLLTEKHSLLFDASELTATISTTPATSTANSGQEGSPLPDSGTLDFYCEKLQYSPK